MAAITWQNVNAPSNKGISEMFTAAQTNMDSGMDRIQGLFDKRLADQQKSYNVGSENNTNAIQDLVASAKTPEELAAMSGQIASMKQEYGNQYNRDAVRGLEATMLDTLRTRANQAVEFDNTQRDQREAPDIDRIRALYAQGKTAEGDAQAAQFDFRNDADVVGYGQDQKRLFNDDRFKLNADNRGNSAEARQVRTANQQTTVFNQGQQAYQDNLNFNQMTRKALGEDEANQLEASNAEREILLANGAANENGEVDTSLMTADDVEAAQQAMRQNPAIDQALKRNTKVIQGELRKSVDRLGTITPEQMATAGNIVTQAEATREALQGADKVVFDNKMGDITTQYAKTDGVFTQAFDEVARGNPFVKELSTATRQSPEKLLSWMGEKDKDGDPLFDPDWSNKWHKSGMLDVVADTMNNPIELGNFKGNVPESIVKRALLEIDGDDGTFGGFGGQLKDGIRRIMEKEGTADAIIEAQSVVDQYKSVMSESAAAKLQDVARLTYNSGVNAGAYNKGESDRVLGRQLKSLKAAEQKLIDAKTAADKTKAAAEVQKQKEALQKQQEKEDKAKAGLDVSSGNPVPQTLSPEREERARRINELMGAKGGS